MMSRAQDLLLPVINFAAVHWTFSGSSFSYLCIVQIPDSGFVLLQNKLKVGLLMDHISLYGRRQGISTDSDIGSQVCSVPSCRYWRCGCSI